MSTPTNPQSSNAMSVFIPRSVAAYESAADRWHGRFFAPTQALSQRTLGFAERLMSSWLGSFHFGWSQPPVARMPFAAPAMNVVRPWYDQQPTPVAAARPMARSIPAAPVASTAASSSPVSSLPSIAFEEMVTITLPADALAAPAATSGSTEAPVERRVREFFPEVVRPQVAAAAVLAQRQAAQAAQTIQAQTIQAQTIQAAQAAQAATVASRASSLAAAAPTAVPLNAASFVEALGAPDAAELAASPLLATPTYVYQPAPGARPLYHLAWADAQLSRASAAPQRAIASTVSSLMGASALPTVELPAAATAAASTAANAEARAALPVETAARMVVRDGFVYLAPTVAAATAARAALATAAAQSATVAAPARAAGSPAAAPVAVDAPLASAPAAFAPTPSAFASIATPAERWQSTMATSAGFASSLPTFAAAPTGVTASPALAASLMVAPTALQQTLGTFLAQRLSTQTLADVGAGPAPATLARLQQLSAPEMVVLQSQAVAAAEAVSRGSTTGTISASRAAPSSAAAMPLSAAPHGNAAAPLSAPATSSAIAATTNDEPLPLLQALGLTTASSRFRPGQLGVQLDSQVQAIVSTLASSWGHTAPAAASAPSLRGAFGAPALGELSYVAPVLAASALAANAASTSSTPASVAAARPVTPASVPAAVSASTLVPFAAATLPSLVEWFMPPALAAAPVGRASAALPTVGAGPMATASTPSLAAAAPTGLPFVAPFVAPSIAPSVLGPATASPTATSTTSTSALRGASGSAAPLAPAATAAWSSAAPGLASLWASFDIASIGPASILSFVEQMPALATLRALQPERVEAAAFATPVVDFASVDGFVDGNAGLRAQVAAAGALRAASAPAMPALEPWSPAAASPAGVWSAAALAALSPQERAAVMTQLSSGRLPTSVANLAAAFPTSVAPAPLGAGAVRSESLATAVALRSSNLSAEFVDPMVLTLLSRDEIAPASAMPSASGLRYMPSSPGLPAAATASASSWTFNSGLHASSVVPMLPLEAMSSSPSASTASAAPSVAPTAPRSVATMAPLEWTLLSLFPSANTAAELGLTLRAASAALNASSGRPAAVGPQSSATLAPELTFTSPAAGAPASGAGATFSRWTGAAAETMAVAASASRAPTMGVLEPLASADIVRLPSGAQPRGGFLWPQTTASSAHASVVQPQMFTDTAVQAQLAAVAGRNLEAPQPLWEMLRGSAAGAGAIERGDLPFVAGQSVSNTEAAQARRSGVEMPAVTTVGSTTGATPAQLAAQRAAEAEHLAPVLSLLRAAPAASNDGGGAPSSIRYDQAMPVISGQPSSEAAATIMQAVRAVGPSAPADDRLTLADLTMITMATSAMDFAASPTAGGGAAPAGGGDAPAGSPSGPGGGGGAGGAEAAPQIEELAQKVYEAYLRLIEIQRERSGESWES